MFCESVGIDPLSIHPEWHMRNGCTLGIGAWKDRIERSFSQDQWIDIMRKLGYGEKAFSKSKAKGQ
eukprot:6773411-Alexandrium_andersonii.AAC.1